MKKGIRIIYLSFVFLLLCSALLHSQGARTALTKADQLMEIEDYQAAKTEYLKALPYFEETANAYAQAHIYLWLGEIAYVEGNYSEALNLTLKSKEIASQSMQVDTLSFYSLMLQNLGVFYSKLGDYENQLNYYEQAFEHAKQFHGQQSTQAADAYFNMGVAYGRRGDWASCIAYTDSSLQISKAIDYQPGIASAYLNLAHSFGVKGDFSKAIDYQNQALQLTEKKGERARGYNNIAMLYNDMGESKLALKYLQKALDIRVKLHPEYHDNILSTQLNFARVYMDEGNLTKGKQYINKVIQNAVLGPEENSAYLKIAYNYKAQILLGQKAYKQAQAYYQKAVAVDGKWLRVDAGISIVGADILLELKDYEGALELIQRALDEEIAQFQPTTIHENPKIETIENIELCTKLLEKKAAVLFAKAMDQTSIGDLEIALKVYELLDDLVMKSRETYRNSESKDLLSANSKALYAGAINVLFHLYQHTGDSFYFEEALAFSEKNKFLSLTEKLNDIYAKSFANIPLEIVKEERQLLQDIEFYSYQLYNNRNTSDQELIQQWQQVLFEKRRERELLLKNIRSNYQQYYDLRYNIETPSSDEIASKLLGSEEAFLEYFLSEETLSIFLVKNGEKQFLQVPIEQDLAQLTSNFRTAILSQSDDFIDIAYELYHILLQPVADAIENHSILIVPDGLLGYLPFEALLTKPTNTPENTYADLPYVLKTNPVRYSFSARSSLQYQNRSDQQGSESLLAMAPVFDSNDALAYLEEDGTIRGNAPKLSSLQGTLRELTGLEQLFGNEGLFLKKSEATETAFKRYASDYSILHIATHTLLDDGAPGLSKLIFHAERSSQEDGFLHAYELYNMALNAELVTLSACNTGFGRLQKGEGIASLASAFAYAGCPNMVMSLWQVKDQTTPILMDYFYENLKARQSKGLSLHNSKLDFINYQKGLYSHPYYWACFVYKGDAQALHTAASPTSSWKWYITAILLFGFAVLGWRRFS